MKKLDAIAADMRTTLDASNARYVHYKLQRGLEVVLERRERGYRLALGRTDVPPSDVEVEVCGQAFRVPHDCELHRTTRQRPGKAGSRTYHVAEMLWSELN